MKFSRLFQYALACTVAVMGWCGAVQAQQLYSITDLGTLGGVVTGAASGNTSGYALNSAGQVTGASLGGPCCTPYAFLYSNGSMTDLGLISNPNAYQSFGYGINAQGAVVGRNSMLGQDSTGRAFLYANGVMTDLGPFVGNSSVAYGINANGQIAGAVELSGIDLSGFTVLYTRPFIYSNGSTIILPLVAGSASRFNSGSAFAINSSGQAAGISQVANGGADHPFLYDGANVIDLGTFGGGEGVAFALNDAAQVTGYSSLPTDPVAGCCFFHAFLYDGTLHDLGALPGDNDSVGYGINSSGQIVGTSCSCSLVGGGFTGTLPPSRAFLYSNGAMIDLTTRIDPTSPLVPYVTLIQGRAINDSGVILALGNDSRLNSTNPPIVITHTYLLTPVASVVKLSASLAAPPAVDSSGNYVLTVQVTNSGNSTASAAGLSSAALVLNLGGRAVTLSPSLSLPTSLGAVAPGKSVSIGLTFAPVAGAAGAPAILRWALASSGGSASGSLRLTVP